MMKARMEWKRARKSKKEGFLVRKTIGEVGRCANDAHALFLGSFLLSQHALQQW